MDGIRALDPTATPSTPYRQRYEIIGYDEIPVDHVSANEHNPRPNFHLGDDDPGLIGLGDSIRTTGQHRPALVFEQLGHYAMADRPGHYVLLQGERRWRACRLAKVDLLRCLTVRTPTSLSEEMEWLGIEEAFKQDWQYFFVLQFAHDLAAQLQVPITSPDIMIKTGLERDDLVVAEKVFKLEPPIQNLVAEYEELEYQNRQARIAGGRPSTGSKAREFSARKAAMVYDICEALKQGFPQIIANIGLSDLDMQVRITTKATRNRATFDEFETLLSMIRNSAANPALGLVTQIAELLENPKHSVKDVLRTSAHKEAGKYRKVINRLAGVEPAVRTMNLHLGQIGTDPVLLGDDLRVVLKLRAALMDLERGIETQMEKYRT